MSGIRGLVFDKDGTLFDFAATWEAWAKGLLKRLGGNDLARVQRLGQAIEFDMQTGKFAPTSVVIAGTAGEVADALVPHVPELPQARLLDLINEEAESAPQHPAVPLPPLLGLLRARGLRLGVATNDAEAPARAHLAQAGVTDLFDFIAGFDSGHGGKPAPGQLLAFAQAVGLPPAQIVMVGDSTHDLQAGRAAGMTTIGVLTGPARRETLAPLADAVLPDIGHLPDWLDARDTDPI
ncbi:HAD family hydrolase [Marimonas sp. MJW-29]|uniref:phosphoglycolate phosphatase n=1 Tax=Sulfitobacter sediminis TaxID=3234186 RepID=A0ABV3RKQ2_9RHOB